MKQVLATRTIKVPKGGTYFVVQPALRCPNFYSLNSQRAAVSCVCCVVQ